MSGQDNEVSRKSVLLVFDEYFGGRDNLVGSYLNLVVKQLEGIGEFVCFTKEPYRGPIIQAAGRKIKFLSTKEASNLSRGFWRRLKGLYDFEPQSFWVTNLSGDFEGLARLMFDVERYHAVICFTQSTAFALAVARLAHVFSAHHVPHLFAVTRKSVIPAADIKDLRWLNMQLLQDSELVPSVEMSAKPADAYLFIRPFSGMAGREIGTLLKSWISKKLRFRRGITVRHFSAILHHSQHVRSKSKNSVARIAEDPSTPVYSFFDNEVFPLRAKRTNNQVNWNELAGLLQPYPSRMRNVVLFVRPDWDFSGSSTSFDSFKSYFRESESLFIEVATWPYFVPFSDQDRWNKLMKGEKHGRPAISFFLRRSAGVAQHFRAFLSRIKLRPKTLSGELLLYYVGSAAPSFMGECLKRAKFNIVFVNHYFTLEFIAPYIKGRKFYLDTHDIQATNVVHQMYRHPFTTKLDSFDDLLKEEVTYLKRAERMSFVSPAEMAMVQDKLPAEHIQYFIPLPVIQPSPRRQLSKIAKLSFIASNNLANEQGVAWFLKEVWPHVLEGAQSANRVDFSLQIVGDINLRFADNQAKKLIFTGPVESLEQVYAESDLILLPVIAGGGVAIKSIEAILHHKPVVATRHALRGLPEGVGESLNPKDGAQEFADHILELLTNEDQFDKQRHLSIAAATRLLDERFYDRLTDSLEAVRLTES
jgi:hypothetical protein